MQTKFKDGSVLICGGCSKDAELEYVGDDGKRVCKVGVAVGKREDASTVWVNVVAWHGLASILSTAKKGDPILVVGKLKSREYNEKTYTDLVADFVSVAPVSAVAAQGVRSVSRPSDIDGPADDDDGELPF